MKIRILTYDGADELDFVGPLEVFRRAAKLRTDIDVALTTLEPQTKVTAAHGLCVHPDGVLEDRVDLLVVPGGGFVNRAPAGVRAEIERGELPRRIAALKKGGGIVAGVCTGTMAVSAAGLLDGRPATTHHAALDNLRATRAHVIEARVVDDGDILTCGGVTSSLDLALWVVERFWGAETAAVVARDLVPGLEMSTSPGRRLGPRPSRCDFWSRFWSASWPNPPLSSRIRISSLTF